MSLLQIIGYSVGVVVACGVALGAVCLVILHVMPPVERSDQ